MIINDVTKVEIASVFEYNFQFDLKVMAGKSKENELVNLEEIESLPLHSVVSVKAKVVNTNPVQLVGKRNLKLMECLAIQNKSIITIAIWVDEVANVRKGGRNH